MTSGVTATVTREHEGAEAVARPLHTGRTTQTQATQAQAVSSA